jgi:hypothetical protein
MKGKFKFLVLLGFIVLTGCESNFDKTEGKSVGVQPPSEIANLFIKDTEYPELRSLEMRRIINEAKMPEAERNEKLLSFKSKKNATLEEKNLFAQLLGFDNINEMIKHIQLSNKLSKKYNLENLNGDDKKEFLNRLTLDYKHFAQKENSNFLSKNALGTNPNGKISSAGWGMPSECWFCVFDYQSCTQGFPVGQYIQYKVMERYGTPIWQQVFETVSTTTFVIGQFSWSDYSWNGEFYSLDWTVTTSNKQEKFEIYTWKNRTPGTSQCTTWYNGCMSSCAQGI